MSSQKPFAALAQETAGSLDLPALLNDRLAAWGLAPWISRLVLLAGALLLAFVAYGLIRRLGVRAIHSLAGRTRTQWDDVLVERGVFHRLSHLVPALVLHLAAPVIFPEEGPREMLQRAMLAYMLLAGVFAASALLSALNRIYEGSSAAAAERPIRSYVQVVKISVWILSLILIVAVLTGRSPWALLGGLGAMTAVLMLVFKDSILGLVASIQLTGNDMVRVGDWIEMPQYGADGNVTEILLATVKVRNWDMTITTIPTYRLISDAFKNWRGMSESGVRRMRRYVVLDMNSVRFVDDDMLERFRKIQLLEGYLDETLEKVRQWNEEQGVDASSVVNGRRLTNLGTFRAYLEAYLRSLPYADPSQTLMVHQKPPTEKGLPLQIYLFSKEQRWAYWEALQADIFDHILAIVPEFGLRVVQMPTGADLRSLAGRLAEPAAGEP